MLAGGGAAWLAATAPQTTSVMEQVFRSVGGALLGLAIAAVSILVFNMFRAPYWQRDTALRRIVELEQQKGSSAPQALHAAAQLHIGAGPCEFAPNGAEGFPPIENTQECPVIMRMLVILNATFLMTIESIVLNVNQQRLQAIDWEPKRVAGYYEQYIYFGIPKSFTKGQRHAQLLAGIGQAEWGSEVFPIRFPDWKQVVDKAHSPQ